MIQILSVCLACNEVFLRRESLSNSLLVFFTSYVSTFSHLLELLLLSLYPAELHDREKTQIG